MYDFCPISKRADSAVWAFPLYSQLSSPLYLFIYLRSQQLPLIFLQKLNTPMACFIISASLWQRVCTPSFAMLLLQLLIMFGYKCVRARIRALRLIFGCLRITMWVFSWWVYTSRANVDIISRHPHIIEFNTTEYNSRLSVPADTHYTLSVLSMTLASARNERE